MVVRTQYVGMQQQQQQQQRHMLSVRWLVLCASAMQKRDNHCRVMYRCIWLVHWLLCGFVLGG
jgi:hypothetical protein